MNTKLKLLLVLTAAGTIALDQLLKAFFLANPDFYRTGGWFELYLTTNTGIAFGIPLTGTALYAALFGIACIVLYYSRFHLNMSLARTVIALGLIIGGGLGNLIDRMRYGYVIDYIKLGHWPLFNVADAAITCAVVILLLWHATIIVRPPHKS